MNRRMSSRLRKSGMKKGAVVKLPIANFAICLGFKRDQRTTRFSVMRLFTGGKLRQIVAINGRKERSKEALSFSLPLLPSSLLLSQIAHLHRLSLSRKIWGWPTPYAHHFQRLYKCHAGNRTSGDRATSIHIKCIPLTDSNYIECTLLYMWDVVL